MNRANLITTRHTLSTGPVSHATPAAAPPDRPSSNSERIGAAAADLPTVFEQDPCPQHPSERATVHDLVAAYRTAREFGVRLLDVTQADVRLNPGDATSAYMQWLATPANFAHVLDEMGCFEVERIDAEGEAHALRQRIVALEAALRTLHARGEIWTTHYNGGVRTVGRSIVDVTGEALEVER